MRLVPAKKRIRPCPLHRAAEQRVALAWPCGLSACAGVAACRIKSGLAKRYDEKMQKLSPPYNLISFIDNERLVNKL